MSEWTYPYFQGANYDEWKLGERREPRETPEPCKGCEAPTCRGCEDNPDKDEEDDDEQ